MGNGNRWLSMTGLLGGALLVVAACSSSASPSAGVLGATGSPSAGASPSTAAMTSITIGSTSDPTLGAYLTGENGMTLYVFTNDSSGTSTCTGTCAAKWPPLILAAGATITGPSGATGTFSLITRPDGSMQAAYNGMPLYYYAGDTAAGQTTGQGYLGKWFVAPLSGAVPTAMPSAMPSEAPSAAASSSSGY
jgi:predicted lipoprotein with Yx(FWY)xxD motif